jgi:CubicO group peptidase (beta-lactamase class C family)
MKKHVVVLIVPAMLLLGIFASGLWAKDPKVVTPESAGLSTERLARFDKAMQEEIDQKRKAGIIVLIARHGSIAYHKAFGMADIESGKKMQTDHLVRLFSMTKPITSAALLTLYEEGKFQLSDPLEQYIPGFRDVKVFARLDDKGEMILEAPKRKITIQDVFRHTAGFGYGGDETTSVGKAYKQAGLDKNTSLEDLANKLTKVPLLFHPGERWNYSFSHDVQARLVEILSGMKFDKYVQAKILQPLGMKDAVFGVPKSYVPRYTTCYGPAKEGGGLQAVDKPESGDYAQYTDRPFGGHSLSSTAMDYFRFSQMLLNKGILDGTRILGRKTVELMTSNNLPPQLTDIGIMGGGTGYGLGVSVLLDPAQAGNLGSKGQFGWGGAATTWVIIDPKEDMISIFLTQYMPMDINIVGRFQTLVYQSIID